MTNPIQPIKLQDYGQAKYDNLIPLYNDQAVPTEQGSLSWIFDSSLEEIRTHTQAPPITEVASRELALKTAEDEFTSATQALQRADTQYAKTGIKDIIPSLVFIPYATAYEYFQAACPGGGADFPDCKPLRVQQVGIQTLLRSSFDQGTGAFATLTPLQRSQLFLQASVASTSMRDHSSEVDYTDSGYLMTDLHAGWQMPLSNTKLFNAIPMGGPSVAISWSHISSDINSFGSNRDKGSLDIGWKQPLFNIPLSENSLNAYLWPSAGIGLSHNELNFGLPQLTSSQWSGTLSSQAILGAELCFNSGVCPSLYGGYAYDRTLWGEPDYHNQGIVAGGAVAFRPFKLKADQK